MVQLIWKIEYCLHVTINQNVFPYLRKKMVIVVKSFRHWPQNRLFSEKIALICEVSKVFSYQLRNALIFSQQCFCLLTDQPLYFLTSLIYARFFYFRRSIYNKPQTGKTSIKFYKFSEKLSRSLPVWTIFGARDAINSNN